MAALQEILDEQSRIKNELQRMENDDTTTEEDSADLRDSYIARWKQLDERAKPIIRRMEDVKSITRAAADDGNLERPAGVADGTSASRFGSPDLVIRTKRDPFENVDHIMSGDMLIARSELRERAVDAIEIVAKRSLVSHDGAEEATRKVLQGGWQSKDNDIASHLLRTGSQEYYDAFERYVRNPDDMVARAALNLGNASGGYLLPYVLDPTIVLTNAASANPYRRISSVKTTTSNAWQGVTSAGVTAAWLAEGIATTDNTPTVGQIQITPLKAAAWVFGSFEVLSDTDFGQQLPVLLSDAKDRLEEAAFATGTGTAAPTGITVGATTLQTTITTGAFVIGDVYNLHAALPPRFRNSPNCAFVCNVAQINRTRQLDTAGGASFWTNLGKDQPEQLLGKGIYESSSQYSGLTTTNKIMVFGDFAQFYIVDRVGVSIIYEPLVTGTGASANLPTGQSGWFMYWRVSSAASTAQAFRTLLT